MSKVTIELTLAECERVNKAIMFWRNYIETGHIILSAEDIIRRGDQNKKILEPEQKQFVKDLGDLADKFLANS